MKDDVYLLIVLSDFINQILNNFLSVYECLFVEYDGVQDEKNLDTSSANIYCLWHFRYFSNSFYLIVVSCNTINLC